MKRSAFTLVELLVVIFILSLLAAIVFPVFARVRREGRKTDTISNLKQCGVALLLYCEDYDGLSSMPSYDAAVTALKDMPSCDLNDTWRSSCNEQWGRPLIGSYGYVRGVMRYSSEEGWREYLDWTSIPKIPSGSLLISVFYANNTASPFHGDMPIMGPNCGISGINCLWPDHVVRFRMDGSVAMTSWQHWHQDCSHQVFDWEGLFFYAE